MSAPAGRAAILCLLVVAWVATASAQVKLIDVVCASGVVNFTATDLATACGGSLKAQLQGTTNVTTGSYTLKVFKPLTPFVLPSETSASALATVTLAATDLPSAGQVKEFPLTGALPASTLCGTAYLVVVLSNGSSLDQEVVSGLIPCKDEAVDLQWQFPSNGPLSIVIRPGQTIDTKVVLKLVNSGASDLKPRMPLDAPEVKVIVAGEGTIPYYYGDSSNM
ncbi:uncharacterized protein LOC108676462 [Hyalella azteca]|uniref:Uncharacterized protein LOC108676462 n=1 Tax=Hyalella azteca TaxID=294128 RepID=A0A8B7P4M7_HYAAZ|nr:uncharacterized protein LOC108676462 [Hyalella azteca]